MPEMDWFSNCYLEAFFKLSSSRSVSMGVGGIPYSEILRYAQTYEPNDVEFMVDVLLKVDATYTKLKNKTKE